MHSLFTKSQIFSGFEQFNESNKLVSTLSDAAC